MKFAASMKNSTKRHVSYAEGYAALGLFDAAWDELEAVDEEDRSVPEVLSARLGLHWEAKHWENLIMVAHELVRRAPQEEKGWIGWAFALREVGRIAEAKAVLREAEPLHGAASAVLHYNLGCYHCLLGEITDARARLAVAFRMHPPFQAAALEDTDLKDMWDELRRSQANRS